MGSLHSRLKRLEEQIAAESSAPHPAEDSSNLFGACILARIRKEIADDEYLPGMSEEERRDTDGYVEAFRMFARSLEDPEAQAYLARLYT